VRVSRSVGRAGERVAGGLDDTSDDYPDSSRDDYPDSSRDDYPDSSRDG
jgi:hypothetical protein